MSVGGRRRHLAFLIDTVLVRDDRGNGLTDRVLIMPFGHGPTDLPVRGKVIRLEPIEWEAEPVAAPSSPSALKVRELAERRRPRSFQRDPGGCLAAIPEAA
jgi:hypothetical protein